MTNKIQIDPTWLDNYNTSKSTLESSSLFKLIEKEATRQGFAGDVKDTLHPSSASVVVKGKHLDFVVGACVRQQWLRIKGFPAEKGASAHLMLTAQLGNMVEDYVVQALRASNILLAPTMFGRQVTIFDKETNVSGLIDAIVNIDGSPVVVEVKSFYGYPTRRGLMGFRKKLNNKWHKVPGEPKPEHMLQTAIYLHRLKERVVGAKLLYFARDDASTEEFNIVLFKDTEGLHRFAIDGRILSWFSMEEILRRFQELRTFLDTDTLPPCDYHKTYDKEYLDKLWLEQEEAEDGPAAKLLGKGNYEKACEELKKKGKTTVGDWRCGYCEFKRLCGKLDKNDAKALQQGNKNGQEELKFNKSN